MLTQLAYLGTSVALALNKPIVYSTIYVYTCVYIYIYRERERERYYTLVILICRPGH